MSTRSRRVVSPTAWTLMTLLCLFVGLYAFVLIASGFDLVPADIADNAFFTPLGLRVHIVAAAVALLVGPWQFVAGVRRRVPRVHRVLGRTYVAGCLIGGTAGAAIALTTTHGRVAGMGFLLLGVAWVLSTGMALRLAMVGDYSRHRRWMIRSFALTFAAVTLRLYLGVAEAADLNYEASYQAVAWISWVPNILIVEWRLRLMPRTSGLLHAAPVSSRT